MKRILVLPFVLVHLLSGTAASAGEEAGAAGLSWSIGLEGGYLAGETSYHITIPTETSILESELVWPLDSALAGIRGEVGRDGVWTLGFSALSNASSSSGVMADSDWINDVKFIFSESDVSSDTFSAFLFRLRGSRRVAAFSRGYAAIEGGYLYQFTDLTASDLLQYSPLGIEEFSASAAGPVVTYKTSLSVPHAGLALAWIPTETVSLTGRAHAGYAFARDEDDHLLRFKLSKGETDGPAFMAGVEAAVALSERVSLGAGAEYLLVRTAGSQDQFFYDGVNRGLSFRNIRDEIDSEQLVITASLTVRFGGGAGN